MNNQSNPVFRSVLNSENYAYDNESSASYAGISIKTLICFLIAVVSGICAIFIPVDLLYPLLIIFPIATFISALIGCRSTAAAKPCAIIYSIGEGLSLGVLTYVCEILFPGIALSAILATATVFGISLLFYSTGIVKASGRLRKFVLISLVSILVFSLFASIFSLFGVTVFADLLYGNGPLAIVVGIFTVFLAAFMLIIDFDDASRIVQNGYSKKYEWLSVLGLMISIVYLYVQILRILIILFAERRN